MKCGEFRAKASHRITIEQKTLTDTAYGGQTVAWSALFTINAVMEPAKGREVFESQQIQSRVDQKFTIRYQSSIKKTSEAGTLRIQYDGRVFYVKYIRNLANDMKQEGTAFQELFAEETGRGFDG